MAKRTGVDLLFHPKKKTAQSSPRKSPQKAGAPAPAPPQPSSQDSSATPASTPGPGTPSTPPTHGSTSTSNTTVPAPGTPNRKPRPRTGDTPVTEPKPAPPEGPYSEYKLLSSALNGWKYDVLKFDARRPVDITTWEKPVKLNRKDYRRAQLAAEEGAAAAAPPQAVGPMLGPDGKPVIGMDGRVVMVDAEGRPIRANANGGGPNGSGGGAGIGGEGGKGKGKESAAKKKFQKKVKQVFLVPDAVRQLRREERYPWVMEDGSGRETWVGSMEEVAKAETQAMFMPAANDIFKFVPAHRWYKFQKKPNYHIPNLEEAETLMSQIEKNKDPERWLLRRRNGQAPSEATAAMFKSEREGSAAPAGPLVYQASQSYGPGGRKLRTVVSGPGDLFGDDDDDEDGGHKKRRIKKEFGQEGDLDELDFEETFADDEEKIENEAEDEEEKEMEERIKREYKTANKTREGYIDESEEEEDDNQLSGAGKAMRKLMKKLEKNTYDDSDDEKNPYASSEEEEPEEEPPQAPQGPAIIPPEPKAPSRSTSQAPTSQLPGAKTPTSTPVPPPSAMKTEPTGSRATSPVPLGHGGHSMVAKRATSPKMPKLKTNGASRAGSPLVGGASPISPVGSPPAMRAESPPAGLASPPLGGMSTKPAKRKAEDSASAGGAGAAAKKKRKAAPGPVVNGGELEEWMLVEWLKQTPNATTRDCIHHFTPYLTDEAKKQGFTKMVKEVAQLKGGVLVLRNAYRGSGAANSPRAMSAEA